MIASRIALRIKDPLLVEKLRNRCEETKVPLSVYVRELIEVDLLGNKPPKKEPKEDSLLFNLAKELIPARADDLAKLIAQGSESKIAMRLLDSFVDALESNSVDPPLPPKVLKSLEKANTISVKIKNE